MMCKFFQPKVPVNLVEMSPNAVETLFKSVKLPIPMGLLDGKYWTTDAETWATVLSKLVASPWAYKDEINDCEDIALEAMLQCSRDYGLNTMGMAIGKSPYGYHAFNIYIVGGTDLWLFEPQFLGSQQYFPLKNDMGYIPDKVLI